MLQGTPRARLSQQTAELLLRATPRVSFGQQAVEVLRSVAMSSGANARRPVMILCISG
jgi:hypothetical protein